MSEKDETFGRRCIIQRTNETTTILGMRERGEREREKEREIGHRIMDFCEIYGIWRETTNSSWYSEKY